MKPCVFIDTGYWIALIDHRDQNHETAKSSLGRVLVDHQPVMSDFVIFETLTYLNCSLGRHDLAVAFLAKTESGDLHVLEVDKATKKESVQLFRRYSDKDFSITDCTSFVLMKNQDIKFFAGFDGHFVQMQFVPVVGST